MIRHGASHGCATLVTTVVAGFIVFLLSRFTPHLLDFLGPVASRIAGVFQISVITEETLGILLLASILAGFWGIAFKVKIS